MMRALALLLLLCFPLISSAAKCDAAQPEDFLTFFFRFSGDKQFAVSRTVYPLKVLAQKYGIDEMGNDLSSVTRLSRPMNQDAELPSLSSILQEGSLIAKVHDQSSNSSVVQVFGENSEWGQTYHFARKGNCWYLGEFREHTISDKHWVEQQEFAPRSHFVPHFFIKPDNQAVRTMLKVLNHLAYIHENLSQSNIDDAKTELGNLCDSLEANPDYAIEERDLFAQQLRDILALFNKGDDLEGTGKLNSVSRALWDKIQ